MLSSPSARMATYSCSAQPPNIPAVPSRTVSLQCPTAEYPCSAQPQSIPAVFLPPSIPAVPNCRVSRRVPLQCPTAEYLCSAQPQSIPVPNCKVSLLCPAAEYPCRAQPQSIPAAPNHQVFLPPSIPAVPNRRVSPTYKETLHFLSNKSFRVGMLEVNIYFSALPHYHEVEHSELQVNGVIGRHFYLEFRGLVAIEGLGLRD